MSEKKHYLKVSKYSELPSAKQRLSYRLLEIMPGLFSWATVGAAIALSRFRPVWVAIFIIVFDVYWLVRACYFSFFLRSTYRKLQRNLNIDWLRRVKDLNLDECPLSISHYKELYHLVVFPAYKESFKVLSEGLESFASNNYPKANIMVVVGLEERRGPEVYELKERLEEEFGSHFHRFLVTIHPKDLPGEVAGKSSNEAWAAKKAKQEIIDQEGIDYEKVIVSSLDADTQIPPGYFARLSYKYLTAKDPVRTSFQPIPLYNNNIWEAPAVARVISLSTTFWEMMLQGKPERQTNFSAYALSLKALVDTGFWNPAVIAEDSHIFYQCFLYYDGDYQLESLYYPVSMDVNVSTSFFKTLVAQYKQQRRWAWGVEDIPYLLFGFWKNRKISFQKKAYKAFVALESHHSWATNALLIFLLGWLPVVMGGEAFNTTVLAFRLPRLTRYILTIAILGIVVCAVIGFRLVPEPPDKPLRRKFYFFLQWVLVPVTLILFGSLPALDAQTRLVLNKRLRYWTAEKVRK